VEAAIDNGTRAVVGVMARAPLPGRCKTRLAGELGAKPAARLYEAMLLDTLEGFGSLAFSDHVLLAAPEDDGKTILERLMPPGWRAVEQVGAGLGQRLTHAADSLGKLGPVLLVSSDSPTLPHDQVYEAASWLDEPGRILLGPCDDGGYYLIGLSAPDPRIFQDIAWSTPEVLSATRARARELGLSLRELPTCLDVDEPRDLLLLCDQLADAPDLAPHTARALREIA
jgi:hypothetical protein